MTHFIEFKTFSKEDKLLLVLVLGILFCTYPFVFNLILPLPSITAIMFISFIIFIVLLTKQKISIYKKITPLIILQIIGTTLGALVNWDFGYYKQVLYIIWGLIMISFIHKIGFKHFLFFYNRIILLIACLGVVSFLLTIINGPLILLEFTQMDGRDGWMIYFTFTNTQVSSFIRYAGIFDEPGAMASWGMFTLLTNKIYVKDKKLEFPLIISLLFTLSLAYIVQLTLYLYCFYIHKSSLKIKLATIIIVLISLVFFLIYIDKDSPIYMLTLGRLGIGTSVDFLEDNNRVRMMEIAKKMFVSSPWFGVGTTNFYMQEYAADNPYESLAKDGIIGTIFIYLPLLKSLMYIRKNSMVIYMIIILGVGYLQRPFHINILHYVMIYLVLISAIYSSKKHQ